MDDQARRVTRPFRFGVVAPIRSDLPAWRDRVRRIADSGYSTLLMPDVPTWQPALAPTLATAAALTDLRIGSWVYAAALREPWSTAWEAHSLSVLTEGRFEMGIGAGRPGIEVEVGLPAVSPADRRARMRETVATLREFDGPDLHTPVVMAVSGPKSQALAREVADAVTFVLSPDDDRAETTRRVSEFAGGRDIELVQHVSAVGDGVAAFMAPPTLDTAALRAADSLLILPSDPAAAAEEIQRRREEIGFSYFVIGGDFAETLAPVVAELAGQ
ncbi:alkanesulfonate monooxygenase SsuD/methylene tetrahydromethanopterin reductase-like flavin-dependent oxidoreductase (luciferase family) [Kribbella sp. VKM Ac-2571]|uniref:LLM class flavin-dependent oxidoreductase n=1 Tax=Kribbella sp. VKM Ac-2571 TaxID=2512222 RepID=UPI00105C0845|nr:LLM class flavin-dependent oxidoreductase [Kribbella sp. VKM Ac-2571]TDO46078.1 alkanesulfonate monooxygenase SsuD/methylene tetrahydromethanopterin reductase-like flavin-dependent oxidoreductase (luciferase family) [Kribbella sp. VKM Ac-2571]